jgi:tetratricopeptide (TPR) repeat protein
VPDITAVEIPKPLNWQDFQRACVPLFRSLLADPLLQEFGREGQAQHGIDLFGSRDGDPRKPVGVQCRRIDEPINEKTIRQEVAKARKFTPPLTELIFATTSDRDGRVQAVAAQITLELHAEGWPCRVIIMGWQDLRPEIAKVPDAANAFGLSPPVLSQPVIDAVREEGASTRARADEQTALILEKLESVTKPHAVIREEYDASLTPEAQSEPASLHATITTYRGFIRKGQTKIALAELTGLLERDPPLPPYARYRVLANVAVVHANAGRHELSLEYFRLAHDLRPHDPQARTNLAFAELANGNRDAASTRASAILADHPDNAFAASVLIQAKISDTSLSDPLTLVPGTTHGAPEFKIASILFLRKRNVESWRTLAKEAAAAHPDNEFLKRFAAEAELEPILSDPEIMLGKQVSKGVFDTIKRCAEVLNVIWTKQIVAEEPNPDQIVPIAANLATAYRYAGDDEAAADVLDRTIAVAGKDPILVRTRSLLYVHADDDKQAIELLRSNDADPETRLFAAQLLVSKQPDQALERLAGVDAASLPAHLQHVVAEIRAEIAMAQNDVGMFRAALDELTTHDAPFSTIEMIAARGHDHGLLASRQENNKTVSAPRPDEGDIDDDLLEDAGLPRQITYLIERVNAQESQLTFADRVQIAQYLDNHNAFETASNLLDGRVAFERDTVGLRTYLSASVGANLGARAKAIIDKLPIEVASIPFYQRMAATHYWNTGDPKSAAPLIKAIYHAAPHRLDLLLWHIDSLIRLGQSERISALLKSTAEDILEGTASQRARLASVLSHFGQPERALKLAYREFALNRNSSAAWMSFMSVMLTAGKSDDMDLLSHVIGPDHSFEIQGSDGMLRRYLVESDEKVRNVEPDALPPDHAIALAVQGKKPGDTVAWPSDGTEAKITGAKHKYLDAFHSALARFNERFPNASGFKQVNVKTDGDGAFSELKAELVARSQYVAEQTKPSYTRQENSPFQCSPT